MLAGSHVLEHNSLFINLLLLAHEDGYTCDAAVKAYPNVEEDEAQKPLIILPTNTLIQPNAMVIKFLDAPITNGTVLRAGWLFNFASWANILLLKHDLVVYIHALRDACLGAILDDSRVNGAGFVKAIIAYKHENGAGVSVIAGEVRAWTVINKHSLHVNIIAAACNTAVKYLDQWVWLVHGPV